MKLSVVIPVYNEENTISELLSKVKKVNLGRVKKEIIVVDDCSTDDTPKILKKVSGIKIITHNKNKGKGAAVRTGFSKATGDVILIQDADLEYDPKDYQRLIDPILDAKAKIVYGTRLKNYPLVMFGKNKTPMPFHLVANKALTFITNGLYRSDLTDMETCYKVFDKKVLHSIKLNSDGFEIEPEITAKVLKKGYIITEVPIKVKPRGYDEGKKIGLVDGFKAIYFLFYFRFFD